MSVAVIAGQRLARRILAKRSGGRPPCARWLLAFSAGTACTMPGAIARADDYPAKPVRVVVANSTGSLADVVSRVLFAKVGELLGQPFLIDNRPGAGGSVGGEAAAKSAGDGYTLLYASDGTMTIAPYLYPSLAYDPVRDFTAVSMVAKIPAGLVAHPSLGVKTLADFVALARAQPDKINYSSGGPGHATHLGMELFASKAGIRLVHVPYKGTGPATQAVLTGEVGASYMGLGLVLPYIQDGRLIGLAIAGPRAAGVLPSVPQLDSLVPGAEFTSWQAVFVPARTPRAVVEKLNGALARAMDAAEVKARVAETGMTIVPSTPAELDSTLRHDLEVNGALARRVGLKAE